MNNQYHMIKNQAKKSIKLSPLYELNRAFIVELNERMAMNRNDRIFQLKDNIYLS